MPNLSVLTIAGYLGRDADLKTAGNASVCEFSVAVNTKRRDGDIVTWYRCQLWGARGEKLAPHLVKGVSVIVVGEFLPRPYTTKKGEERLSLEINVQSLSFAGGGAGEGPVAKPHSVSNPAPTPAADDEIPF